MTVEKSAPRINQLNFFYDEDGNVISGSAHVTYDLLEEDVVLTTYSETVGLESMSEADFAVIVALVPTVSSYVTTKTQAVLVNRKAVADAARLAAAEVVVEAKEK